MTSTKEIDLEIAIEKYLTGTTREMVKSSELES